jgi:hypothetical protein
VAGKLRWRTRHRPAASWRDLGAVLAGLREHLGLEEGQLPPPGARLPTHAELRAAGKHELRCSAVQCKVGAGGVVLAPALAPVLAPVSGRCSAALPRGKRTLPWPDGA